MTDSSLVGGKVGKKLEALGNIQNVGSQLFSINHDLTLDKPDPSIFEKNSNWYLKEA